MADLYTQIVNNSVGNLVARVGDIQARLASRSELKNDETAKAYVGSDFGGPRPPEPTRQLHDSLDQASASVAAINDRLDQIERRL